MWSQRELIALIQLKGKVNAFGNNETDEFTIVHGGKRLGIFKSWSIPVIPFLDRGNIEVLSKLWPHIIAIAETSDFWQALHILSKAGETAIRSMAVSAIETLETWRKFCLENPVALERSLERSRLLSWLLDLELTKAFDEEQLSESPVKRIYQLVNRLELSFSLLSPFYHLEALVGNPQWLYGSRKAPKSLPGSGKLDIVALLLPAALRDYVVADRLDWHGTSWANLRTTTKSMLSDPTLRRILLNISRMAGIPPHHVLFVANALEWIPMRVGGKKDDKLPTGQALAQLSRIISENEPAPKEKNAATVLSEINALIRFLNWVPLIEDERNFKGLHWVYSSVCDTSNALLDTLLVNPHAWKPDFRPVFEDKLRRQMGHLDATSAKGRFLLQLVGEGKLKSSFTPTSDTDWKTKVVKRVSRSLSAKFGATSTIPPRSLVGDKAFGMSLACQVLGTSRIVNGFTITSDEVESTLRTDGELWNGILELHQERNLSRKLSLASKISKRIKRIELPGWSSRAIRSRMESYTGTKAWAIRSSSLEEGEARGVYASKLRIPTSNVELALRQCVASFFSKDAMMFRLTSRAGDLPTFAVQILPYRKGRGGVATHIREGESRRVSVSVGPSAAAVTSNGHGVQTIDLNDSAKVDSLSAEISEIFGELESVFDHIQIEWVRAIDNVQLLQMDFLHQRPVSTKAKEPSDFTISLGSLKEVVVIERELQKRAGFVSLMLGSGIKLDSFQGELFSLIARFGQRICEVRTESAVTETSHFANICRHFGIRLTQS